MLIRELVTYLDNKYPHQLAWDADLVRIGFVIGNQDNETKKVLLTLDVTSEVVEEAIQVGANLIIAHHPIIFNPIYKIDFNTEIGKVLKTLIINDISVYTMHTNLDVATNGVNDTIAKKLGLENIVGEEQKESYLRYGEVEEVKFFDYFKIIKSKLGVEGFRYAGDLKKVIKKVGVIGGSGGRIPDIKKAIDLGLDLYISSEFSLSSAQYAVNNGLCIIEVNHGIEKLVLETLKLEFEKEFKVDFLISKIETDPFKYFI